MFFKIYIWVPVLFQICILKTLSPRLWLMLKLVRRLTLTKMSSSLLSPVLPAIRGFSLYFQEQPAELPPRAYFLCSGWEGRPISGQQRNVADCGLTWQPQNKETLTSL